MKRFYSIFKENPVWAKVILFSLTLFFLRVADGIISFWAPIQIQSILNDSFYMGLIISFQSVVGFCADLIFPSLLYSANARKLAYLGIVVSGITALTLIASVYFPFILIFLATMLFWGIYYELINFSQFQFVEVSVPPAMRSGAWGVSGVFSNLAYFLGPVIAAQLLIRSTIFTEIVIWIFLIAGLLILGLSTPKNHATQPENSEKLKPLTELKHWLVLAKTIWPMVVVSMLLGACDSSFWTIGAVWSEKLAKTSFLGGMFLPAYQFPSIILGLIVAKWGIYKGKKILTEKYLIIAGLFLMAIGLSDSVVWQISMVLLSASGVAICYPLLNGVYSDLVSRMGHKKKDMIGLTNSSVNIAYIIWPPVVGLISSQIGERMTFSYLGLLIILTAIGLLFVTPKKLRLPQSVINTWD